MYLFNWNALNFSSKYMTMSYITHSRFACKMCNFADNGQICKWDLI